MELIEYWRELDENKKPLIHPDDSAILEADYFNGKTYDDYIKSDYFGTDKSVFHLGLLPVPYVGDIENATIYILLLNPGFSILNYFEETFNRQLKKVMLKNLFQTDLDSDFPFFYLNPKYHWTGGGQYWSNKLDSILQHTSKELGLTYYDSLKLLSKKLAVLELVPYHSNSYNLKKRIFEQIESKNRMINFTHTYLKKKLENNTACALITRKSQEWNFMPTKNVMIYSAQEARSAHITMNTRGGHLLYSFLCS
jgi:hypothetical protein